MQQEVYFSSVSYNGSEPELIDYLPEEEKAVLRPEREGWSFGTWKDGEGILLLPETVTDGVTYYAQWIDDVPPVLTVTSTRNTAPYQEVLMEADDIASEIYGYYAGKDNPEETEVTYSINPVKQNRVKVEEPGKYYFSVQDACGNRTTESLEFIRISFVTEKDEETACESVLAKEGDTLQLPDVKKRGYTLVGWIRMDETNDEEKTPVTEYTFTEEASFEPIFEANKYQVYLNGNGGACAVQSMEVTFGETYPQLPKAELAGYNFLGWAKTVNGEVLSQDALYEIDGDSTLYAKWTPIHYTVRYLGNGNTGGTMGSIDCTYNVEFVHPRNAYVKTGYVFKGWSTNPNTISTQNALTARDRVYNGAEWLNEDKAINLTTETEAVVNLYAIWQKIEVGVMDYRYCMGKYMYFACTTTNYRTENAADNGALFVGITPAGASVFGTNATWATSAIRNNLNNLNLNDMTGLKKTDTTVNYSYEGMMWEYDPYRESPCTLADKGYAGKMVGNAISNRVQTVDYMFIPDMRDCYNYYAGNSWNWFWDINLDGYPDVSTLVGMSTSGPDDSYYDCIGALSENWRNLGWNSRYWLRNQYTNWNNYPFYIAQYGVSACNPAYGLFGNVYGNLGTSTEYLIRPMYTMWP